MLVVTNIITKCLGLQIIDILPFCLFTWNFYNTRHKDHDFWDSAESKRIIQAASCQDGRFVQYFKGLLKVCTDTCADVRLLVESTCSWLLAEENTNFELW